jgi:predicted dehydrogenase
MKTVNVGVIGLGFMGMVHLKAYKQVPGTRIAAIADAFKQPVNGVIAGVGGNITGGDAFQLDADTKFYANWEELLADPGVDLVDICVPTSDHVKISLAALQAGKHVLCEKPMARTSALCREIVQAAATAKGAFMPAMCMRFWPGWDWLKAAITNQTYGKVLAARFRRVSAPPGWSRGTYFKGGESGGALLDLHIHDTDFVQFCFGRPQAVFSSGCTRFSGAIDHVATAYHVAGGAVVTAEGSWIMNEGFPFTMTYTVNFEKATADFDISRGADALKLYEEGQPAATVKLGEGDGYIGELRHLVESIQNGVRPSIVTAQDGASAVEICEAEERSAQTGQVLKL